MKPSRDLPGDMDSYFNGAIDEATAERLLSCRIEPDDAPPACAAVASLLAAVSEMRVPATPAMERMTLDSMASAIETLPANLPVAPRRSSARVRSKFFRAKVVGALVFSSVVGTAGLAMAGALPRPAQDIASTMLAKIGVSAPHPDAAHQDTHVTPAGGTTSGGRSGSGQGSVISGIAHSTTGAKGPTVCQAASDGNCQAGEHGHGNENGNPAQHARDDQNGRGQDSNDNGGTPARSPRDGGNGSSGSHGDGSGNSASRGSDKGSAGKGAGSGNSGSHP